MQIELLKAIGTEPAIITVRKRKPRYGFLLKRVNPSPIIVILAVTFPWPGVYTCH